MQKSCEFFCTLIHYISMTPEEYILLYERFLSGKCTPDEEKRLMEYQDNFSFPEDEDAILSAEDKEKRSRIFQQIDRTTKRPKVVKLRWWRAAAAIVIGMAGIAGLYSIKQTQKTITEKNAAPTIAHPILPGSNKATLTLANGATVTLDDAANGVVAQAGNTDIKKIRKGLLSYEGSDASGAATLNTISVPRGGQYAVVLADGTSVWLNSESSLTYPVAFSGHERKVILKGEAYFEVSRNAQQPFIVQADVAEVKVLGTSFNINAYKDERDIRATLLTGSVRVSKGADGTLLVPGEQGVINTAGISKRKVRTDQVVAWKAGYFIFRDNTIQDIMRQVGRWYDVEVEYKEIPQGAFGGTFSKNKDIKELLNALELTGLIHFKIEGRKIIVMK